MVEAWLRACGQAAEHVSRDLPKRLHAFDIKFSERQKDWSPTHGLFVFDNVDDESLRLVSELARGGRRRVLCLPVNEMQCDDGSARALMAAGGADVLTWDDSKETAADIAARLTRWSEVDALMRSAAVTGLAVGQSQAWLAALSQVMEAARFTDDSILFLGESGTGKELGARLVHRLDPRRGQAALTIVDCATIVPSLSGSEFFGHERGAFTGATSSRKSAFEQADGGLLFLDEIGELPADLQAQLLRVIQERRFKRIGGNSWRDTDFRLIAATNKDLWQEVTAGRFRRDLYYRIASWTITLPPLAQRVADILPLAEHFLGATAGDDVSPTLSPPVRAFLLRRRYPGNVRDLRQLCQRMRGRHVGSPRFSIGDIPPDERAGLRHGDGAWWQGGFEDSIRRAVDLGIGLKEISAIAADVAVEVATECSTGNLAEAAERLKVTPRALQLRKRKHLARDDLAD